MLLSESSYFVIRSITKALTETKELNLFIKQQKWLYLQDLGWELSTFFLLLV